MSRARRRGGSTVPGGIPRRFTRWRGSGGPSKRSLAHGMNAEPLPAHRRVHDPQQGLNLSMGHNNFLETTTPRVPPTKGAVPSHTFSLSPSFKHRGIRPATLNCSVTHTHTHAHVVRPNPSLARPSIVPLPTLRATHLGHGELGDVVHEGHHWLQGRQLPRATAEAPKRRGGRGHSRGELRGGRGDWRRGAVLLAL